MSRLAALFPALLLALPAAAIAGPAENKAVASRVILEKMGQGRFDIQPEIYGPGFVAHGFGRHFTLAEGEGKRVAVDGMSFFRFADGKIVEEWSTYDNLTIMQQLGLIPSKPVNAPAEPRP